MEISIFTDSDIEDIVSLFYGTVHSVNAKDYSQKQLNAWAAKDEKDMKIISWRESLSKNMTYVAKINNKVVGFSDLTNTGYLDRLYVHKDFQRCGIASALINELEKEAMKHGILEITTEASITAKTFFEIKGFKVISKQIVVRKGAKLENYKMVKNLAI